MELTLQRLRIFQCRVAHDTSLIHAARYSLKHNVPPHAYLAEFPQIGVASAVDIERYAEVKHHTLVWLLPDLVVGRKVIIIAGLFARGSWRRFLPAVALVALIIIVVQPRGQFLNSFVKGPDLGLELCHPRFKTLHTIMRECGGSAEQQWHHEEP